MHSDFDLMLKVRLPNWGFWGRENADKPDPERGSGSIYAMGKSAPGGDVWTSYKCYPCAVEAPDPGKCKRCGVVMLEITERIEPEPPPPPVDVKDAEWLDKLIFPLYKDHRRAIQAHFYRREDGWVRHVPAAVRALVDAEEAALHRPRRDAA